MYPSRAYPVFINMKQVGVSLPLPLPGWNASLQKKMEKPKFTSEKNRGTAQLPQNGTIAQGGEGWGGWVSRERGVGKEGEKGLLSAHVFKILRSFLQVYGHYLLSVGNSHFSIRAWTSVCIRAEVKIWNSSIDPSKKPSGFPLNFAISTDVLQPTKDSFTISFVVVTIFSPFTNIFTFPKAAL